MTPEIFQNFGLFDVSRRAAVRPGQSEGATPETNGYSFLHHPFFSASSTTSTTVERTDCQGVVHYPFLAAYAFPGGTVAGQASDVEDSESFFGDGGDESSEWSVSRTPRRTTSVARGPKARSKIPVLMLAVTVVFAVMFAYTKYQLGGLKFLGDVLPSALSGISGKPSGDVTGVPRSSRTKKALVLGTTLIVSALLLPEILRHAAAVLEAETVLGSAVHDAGGPGWLSMTIGSGVILGVLVSALLARAIFVFPRKSEDKGPPQGPKEEAPSKPKQERAPRTPPRERTGLDLKELPPRLEVLHAPDVKEGPAAIVYKPGSPAVENVAQAVSKLVEEVGPVSPPLAAAMRKAVDDIRKPPEELEASLPGANFELHVRRVVTLCYRAQLAILRQNLWRLEDHFFKGLFAGRPAFLTEQLEAHRAFAQVLRVEFGRNRRSTAAVVAALHPKKKKSEPLLSFLNAEAEAFEAFVGCNEKRLGVITHFAEEDGGVRSGVEGEARAALEEVKRRWLEARHKFIAFFKPELLPSFAAPWKDL